MMVIIMMITIMITMMVMRLLLMMKSNVQIFHFIPALRFHVMNSTASFWLYNAKNYYITRNYYILYQNVQKAVYHYQKGYSLLNLIHRV